MIEDDRVTCLQCRYSASGRCGEMRISVDLELPRRCTTFAPLGDARDQRKGEQRWPGLTAAIAQASAEDIAHRKAHG